MLRNARHPRPALLVTVAGCVLLLGACGVSVGTKPGESPRAASHPSAPTVTVTRTTAPSESTAPTQDSSSGTDQQDAAEGLGHGSATTEVLPPTSGAPKPTYDLSRMSMPGFVTPSHNIGCLFDHYDGAHVRCDRREFDHAPGGKPADCDLDWGHAVELPRGGRGQLACVGDTVLELHGQTDGSRVLQYGQTARYRGILCTSRMTGLTCTSGAHGFTISRASIRAF